VKRKNAKQLTPWKFCNSLGLVGNIEEDRSIYGFIYSIHCKRLGKNYIGKKAIYKGTDWKKYTGSSKELNLDIKRLGIEQFTFTITKLCTTPFELMLEEAKAILTNDAITSPHFYNSYLFIKLFRKKDAR